MAKRSNFIADVTIHNEVIEGNEGNWRLCFQACTYHYDDESAEDGYRFIWRTPEGALQPARGQARIPSATVLTSLIARAYLQGWLR